MHSGPSPVDSSPSQERNGLHHVVFGRKCVVDEERRAQLKDAFEVVSPENDYLTDSGFAAYGIRYASETLVDR